ncbi:MAG: T9SS type A sorting domain-containing protein [Bacteroidia bacterium]
MNPSTGANPVGSTPDYYNQCATPASGVDVPNNDFGFQQPHSGNAYSGIYIWEHGGNNYREYIEVPLVSTLTAGSCYHFEMYVNLCNFCKYTTDNVAVYFSDTAVENINNWLPLPFIPQINNMTGNEPDSLNWTTVDGNYTANGTEKYLIIGNFNDDANTDTTLYNSNVPSWHNRVYFYIDDVSLSLCTAIDEYNSSEVIIYPNPFTDIINITIKKNEFVEISLYDVTSRKLLQQKFTTSTTLNTSHLAKGIYIYEVRNDKGVVKKGKVVRE